jgi:hypothetical protein
MVAAYQPKPVDDTWVDANLDDLEDFDDDEDALDVSDEREALLTSFKTAQRDDATCQLMAIEWQALAAGRAAVQFFSVEAHHVAGEAVVEARQSRQAEMG